MFYKFLLATTTVAIFAAQAAAAPSVKTGSEMKASSNNDSRAVFIAPDAIDACNCPDDCQHKLGDSCKFYKEGNIVTAICRASDDKGLLECRQKAHRG